MYLIVSHAMKNSICILCLVMFTGVLQSQVTPQTAPFDAPEMVWPMTAADSLTPSPYFDRFGNNIPLSMIYRKTDLFKKRIDTAGHFIVHYSDDDKNGFENPTDGPRYRAVLEQVLKDLSALINTPPVDPCTGEPARVHIAVNHAKLNLNGALGIALAVYDTRYGNQTIIDGEVWKKLNTGAASEEDIYQGYIEIRFNNQTDWYTELQPGPFNGIEEAQFDLYTVILHEVLHTMGYISMIDQNGNSKMGSSVLSDSYFSRFDGIMKHDGDSVLTTSTPATPFYNVSSVIDSAGVRAGCSRVTLQSGSCGYLSTHVGVYAPAIFDGGSSLSHITGCGDSADYVMRHELTSGQMFRTPELEEVQILAELGYNITGVYGATPLNPESFRADYSPMGQTLGGVDDAYNCDGSPLYLIENCSTDPLVIPIIDNDGATPDSIVGLRVLDNASATVQLVNNQIHYTSPGNGLLGYVTLQYVPMYGCAYGNLTEVRIYHYPCADGGLCEDGSPLCFRNCFGEITPANDSAYGACVVMGELSSNQIPVPNWMPTDYSYDPPVVFAINSSVAMPNYGIQLDSDQGLVHSMRMDSGQSYLMTLRVKWRGIAGGNVSWCNEQAAKRGFLKLLRMRGGSGIYEPHPYFFGEFAPSEQYYIEKGYGIVQDIPASELPENQWVDYRFCYTPQTDMDFLILHFDGQVYDSTQANYLHSKLMVDELNIRPMNTDLTDTVVIGCLENFVNIALDNTCGVYDHLQPRWLTADGILKSDSLSVQLQSSGGYYLEILGDNQTCHVDSFAVYSNSGFTVDEQVTHVDCDNGIPGAIDLTITGEDSGSVYTVLWNTGDTTEDLHDLQPGLYSVDISNEDCAQHKEFLIQGDSLTLMGIVHDLPAGGICEGTTAELRTSDGLAANWFLNGSPVAGGSGVDRISISTGGLYRIERSPVGGKCYMPFTLEIGSIAAPDVAIIEADTVCSGDPVTLIPIVNPEGGDFMWKDGGGNFLSEESMLTITPTQSADYSLTYSVNGCGTTVSTHIEVIAHPSVTPPQQTICQGERLSISLGSVPSGTQVDLTTPLTPLDDWNGSVLDAMPLRTTNYDFVFTNDQNQQCTETVKITVKRVHEMIIPGNLQSGLTVDSGMVKRFDQTDGQLWVHGPIHVKSGGELVLDQADVRFVNNFDILEQTGYQHTKALSGIVVEPGGIVNTDNQTVMAGLDQICPQMWEGIQVWGDDMRRYLSPAMDPVIDNNPAPGTIVIPDVIQSMALSQ